VPQGGFNEGKGDIKNQELCTEPASLGIAALHTTKK